MAVAKGEKTAVEKRGEYTRNLNTEPELSEHFRKTVFQLRTLRYVAGGTGTLSLCPAARIRPRSRLVDPFLSRLLRTPSIFSLEDFDATSPFTPAPPFTFYTVWHAKHALWPSVPFTPSSPLQIRVSKVVGFTIGRTGSSNCEINSAMSTLTDFHITRLLS